MTNEEMGMTALMIPALPSNGDLVEVHVFERLDAVLRSAGFTLPGKTGPRPGA